MIRAINDVVIIERDGYNGVLIAPFEKMCHGTVLSVGPGAWIANVWDIDPITRHVDEKWIKTSLKPGDRVCFSLDKGEEHIIEGKHVVVMRESHIAGVLEDDVVPQSLYDELDSFGKSLAEAAEALYLESLNGKEGNLDMDYRMISAQNGY